MKEIDETTIFTAFEGDESDFEIEPEKELLRAILATALEDLRKDGDLARRAVSYFLSKEEDYLFSFRSICQFLEIDPHRFLILAGIRETARALDRKEVEERAE